VASLRTDSGPFHLQPAYAADAARIVPPSSHERKVVFLGLEDRDLDLLRRARERFGDFDIVLEHRGRCVAILAAGDKCDLGGA